MRQATRRGVAPLNENPKWQIGQARDALDLYYEQFRGIPLAPRPDNSAQTSPSSPSKQPPQERDYLLANARPALQEPIANLSPNY